MTDPLVSVVIPTYNYGHFIDEAVQSVLNQSFRDFEIIVVDDGSTDNTNALLARHSEHIRYVRQTNSGVSAARNRGIKEARGKFIAFLDADDYWLPEKLLEQLKVFDDHPDVGMVYSLFYFFESETHSIIGYKPIIECHRGFVLKEMFVSCMVGSPTPLIKRKVFDEVGPFKEELRGTEDYEMWLRICAHYKLDFVPKYLAMYRVHSSTQADTKTLDKWAEQLVRVITEYYTKYSHLLTEDDYKQRLCCLYHAVAERSYLSGEKTQALKYLSLARQHNHKWSDGLWWLTISTWTKNPRSYNDALLNYHRGKILVANGKRGPALKSFIRSLWDNPFKKQVWAGVALCFLPKLLTKRILALFVNQPIPSATATYSQY